MKIYTKTGDSGETSVLGGGRVSKSSLVMDCVGSIDELNSVLGLARFYVKQQEISSFLKKIQNLLFKLGTFIVSKKGERTKFVSIEFDGVLKEMEDMIDSLETELEPLKQFILPGGSEGSAWLHFARTVCRRAERDVVKLMDEINDSELVNAVKVLNRMSDLLFVSARVENRFSGVPDVVAEF